MLKKVLIGIVVALILLAVIGFAYYRLAVYDPPPISAEDRAAIRLLPLPAKLELTKGDITVTGGFDIIYEKCQNDIIEKSVARFNSRLEILRQNNNAIHLIVLNIVCDDASPTDLPQLNEDESYTLDVRKGGINLRAPSLYGILRGLETLYQLIQKRDDQLILPKVKITDQPRFAWRGLMLDVCRHWIPKDVILRTLDAMSIVKMNVFHWHLSEDQGFRVESKVFPKLHELGSNGKYYTQEEIKEVISYAADRGIRIVPEFDLPGHSKSWQIAYPELSTVDYPLQFGRQKGEAFAPPIDPSKELVYEFLDKFVEEMANLFPDEYFHIGGDEVNPKYWNESSGVQSFMKNNGLENGHDLQAHFNNRIHTILKKYNKKMLGWNEIFSPELSDEVMIQSWTSHKSLFEAVQNGGKAILSTGYYLDHILPAKDHYSNDPIVLAGAVDIEPDTSFWKMYDLKMEIAGSEMESQLVLFDSNANDVSGFLALLSDRIAFRNGSIKDNQLTFEFNGPVGEMKYSASLLGDSLEGKISFGLMSFTLRGKRSGGSDMEGTAIPLIEVIKPLTQEEEARIIGGEACLWSEFVDANNVESRLWPRTAAIAEKLWSPQGLTDDPDDMYRRLELLSNQLTDQGSRHDVQYEKKLKAILPLKGLPNLKNITDFLQEVAYHGRMPDLLDMEDLYLPDYALDRLVDAVRPESYQSRNFNQLVDSFMISPEKQNLRDKISAQLNIWKINHDQLLPYIENNAKLAEIEKISKELSLVSEAALNRLNGQVIDSEKIVGKLHFLRTGEYGMIAPVESGLRRLITEM